MKLEIIDDALRRETISKENARKKLKQEDKRLEEDYHKRENQFTKAELLQQCYKDQYGYYFIDHAKEVIVVDDNFNVVLEFTSDRVGRFVNNSMRRVSLQEWTYDIIKFFSVVGYYTFDFSDSYPLLLAMYSKTGTSYKPLTEEEFFNKSFIFPDQERVLDNFRLIKNLLPLYKSAPSIDLDQHKLLKFKHNDLYDNDLRFDFVLRFFREFTEEKRICTIYCRSEEGISKYNNYYIGIVGRDDIVLFDILHDFNKINFVNIGSNTEFWKFLSCKENYYYKSLESIRFYKSLEEFFYVIPDKYPDVNVLKSFGKYISKELSTSTNITEIINFIKNNI